MADRRYAFFVVHFLSEFALASGRQTYFVRVGVEGILRAAVTILCVWDARSSCLGKLGRAGENV